MTRKTFGEHLKTARSRRANASERPEPGSPVLHAVFSIQLTWPQDTILSLHVSWGQRRWLFDSLNLLSTHSPPFADRCAQWRNPKGVSGQRKEIFSTMLTKYCSSHEVNGRTDKSSAINPPQALNLRVLCTKLSSAWPSWLEEGCLSPPTGAILVTPSALSGKDL